MAEDDSKRERADTDPARLSQLLELELIQKRAEWQQTKARRRNFRALSFLFLFVVIAGAIVAFVVFFSSDRGSDSRSNQHARPTPVESSP